MGVGYQELLPGLKHRIGNGGGSGASNGTYIVKPTFNKVKLNTVSSIVNIGFAGFNMDFDTLLVFKNGTFMTPNEYYNVISNTQIQATEGESWEIGTVFDFVALIINNAPSAVKQSSFKNSFSITSNKTFVELGIDFDSSADTLLFFKNGVYQELNVDYTCDDIYIYPKGNVTTFKASVDKPMSFNIIVLRNVIDGAVLTSFDGQYLKDGSITEIKLDPAILQKAYAYTDKTKSDLLGGVDAAYDTLKEIEIELKNDDNVATSLLNKINTNTADIGDITKLPTTNKTDIVESIIEVFQSGVDTKNNVVNAINNNGGLANTSMTWTDIIDIMSKLFNNIGYNKWITGYSKFSHMEIDKFNFGCVEVNGNVYCIGGASNVSLYIYNIALDTWTRGSDILIASTSYRAVKVNSKIYCFPYDKKYICILDTLDNTWSSISIPANIPTTISGVVLYNNLLYCITLSNVIIYDISANTWVVGSNRNSGDLCETILDGTLIYCINHSIDGSDTLVQTYDISTDSWLTWDNINNVNVAHYKGMSLPRFGFRCVLYSGKIYAIGGIVPFKGDSNYIEAYDILSNTWSVLNNMPDSRTEFGIIIYNKKIYCIAGRGSIIVDGNTTSTNIAETNVFLLE